MNNRYEFFKQRLEYVLEIYERDRASGIQASDLLSEANAAIVKSQMFSKEELESGLSRAVNDHIVAYNRHTQVVTFI